MSDTLFATQRLSCRRWRKTDLEAIYAAYSDPEAMRWVGDGTPITRDACERWYGITVNNYTERGYGMFALESRGDGGVVGFCGITHPDGQVEPEIKYTIMRELWGQGYASEAVPALVRYAIAELGLAYMIATVDPENLASQRILKKAGFQQAPARTESDGSTTLVFTVISSSS